MSEQTQVVERSPAEVLRAAKVRIRDPKRWTQHAYARDADGRKCEPHAEAAKCWCAAGALFCELGLSSEVDHAGAQIPAFDLLVEAAKPTLISALNDRLDSHETVLQLYDRAIALATEEASK